MCLRTNNAVSTLSMKNTKRFISDLAYRKWKILYIAQRSNCILLNHTDNEFHFKVVGLKSTSDGEAEIKVDFINRNVTSILHHPVHGKRELLRKNCSPTLIEKIFKYPRVHTEKLPNGVLAASGKQIVRVQSIFSEKNLTPRIPINDILK